jgi:uncharacterized membrane protein SpoIIM required for sporulation
MVDTTNRLLGRFSIKPIQICFYLSCQLYLFACIVGVLTGLCTKGLLPILVLHLSKTKITVLHIFLKNMEINLLSIFGGLLICFIPAILLVVNGFWLGYGITVSILKVAHSFNITNALTVVFYGIAPHAIPELLALFISGALGIALGLSVLKIIFKDVDNKLCLVYRSVLMLLPIIIILDYIAVYIEVNFSYPLVKQLMYKLAINP